MSTETIDLTQLTGDYTIDASHSTLGFTARHAMVTKVRGAFNEFEGTVHADAADPSKSSAKITIQAASIDTRNADRDAHLKSNDFFAMDEFPTLTFESTQAEKVNDETYRVTGDLTVRGVTKPVSIDFEFTGAVEDPWGNTRIGFEGSTSLNRKDFGLTWNSPLAAGGVLVSEKVNLEFDLSLVKNA
ncbi:MAG TPA: YceI family protein [Acidimicrobiales bacterium]